LGFYTFKLLTCHIANTRSRHKDTDTVAFTLSIDGRTLPIQQKALGDLNNGDYPIDLTYSMVYIGAPTAIVTFNYTIYNGDQSKLGTGITDISDQLADKATDFVKQKVENGDLSDYTDFPQSDPPEPDAGQDYFEDASWTLYLEYLSLANFVFPDCDGFVAVGTQANTRGCWDSLIKARGGGALSRSIRYPGDNSPAGCGGNSDYTVSWSVARARPADGAPHSLRRFLQGVGASPATGIRRLAGNQQTSLIDLLGLS